MGSVQSVQGDFKLRHPREAAELFRRACSKQQLMGSEWERGIYYADNGHPVDYRGNDGRPGMADIFAGLLAKKSGWVAQSEFDGGPVIGLRKVRVGGKASNPADFCEWVLEPGNQLELVTPALDVRQLPRLNGMVRQMNGELTEVCDRLGLLVGKSGWTPTEAPGGLLRAPKTRYPPMYALMSQDDKEAASDTSSVQFTFDQKDEKTAIEMARVMLGMMPLFTAMANNSPLKFGAYRGFESERMERWNHYLDDRPEHKPRMGNMPWVFDKDISYEKYAERVARLPLMFVVDNGIYKPAQGETFSQLIDKGEATLSSFADFLTSTTYDIRWKRGLEARQMDTPDNPRMVMGLGTLWAALLYDDQARHQMHELVTGWKQPTRDQLRWDVPRLGLETAVSDGTNRTLRDLGREVLGVAEQAIGRLYKGKKDMAEVQSYLEPLREVVDGRNAAHKTIVQLGLEKSPSRQSECMFLSNHDIMSTLWLIRRNHVTGSMGYNQTRSALG